MRVALLLLLLPVPPQDPPTDPTVEQIIERMEKTAAAARGSRFVATPLEGLPAEFIIATDGTVRIQEPPPEDLKKPGSKMRYRLTVLRKEAYFDVVDDLASLWAEVARPSVRRIAEKFHPSECDRFDPFWQNSGGGAYHPWSWHRWLFALSPKFAFAYERDLRLAGRRRFQGEECFVLLSGRPLDYGFTRKGPAGNEESGGYTSQRRKFYVRASDWTLKRIVEINQWGVSDYPGYDDCVFDRSEGGIPKGVIRDKGTLGISTREIRRGLAIEGASLLPDSADLYASQARYSSVGERLARSPDNADLLFSEAIYESHRRYGGEQKAKTFDEKFARIVEGTWAVTPVRNLISLLIDTGDLPALRSLLTRVESDPAIASNAVLERVRGWMKVDDLDKAAAALKSAPEPDLPGLPPAHVELALRRGDYAAAVKGYLAWPVPPGEYGLHTLAGQLLGLGWKLKNAGFTQASLLKAVEDALESSPKSEPLLAARLQFINEVEDPARIAAIIRQTLERSTDRFLRRSALHALRDLIPRVESGSPARGRVLEALAAGEGQPGAAALRGGLFAQEGKVKEALREFRKEADLVEKLDGPAETAGWVAKAAEGLGDPELRERACLLQLRHFRRTRTDPGHYAWHNHNPDPMPFLRDRLGAGGRYQDLYQAVRGIPFPYGFAVFRDPAGRINMKELGLAVMDAGRAEKDPVFIRWFAHMMVRTHGQTAAACEFDSLEFLLKARDADPRDLETRQRLAEKQSSALLDRDAIETARSIRELAAAGVTCEGGWSPAEATIFVAEQHLRGGRKEEARSALNGLDWEREDCPSWNLWRAAEIYDSLGDFEKTAFLLRRSEEDGHRPYYRLAELAVRKEEWVEATRQINRALAFGCTSFVVKPGQAATQEQFNSRITPEAIVKLRDAIRARAGDLLIRRLLDSALPSLSPEETARAQKALRGLESGTIPEREQALKDFRDLGPKSAPVLWKFLSEPDSIWRTSAKELLLFWAEPR